MISSSTTSKNTNSRSSRRIIIGSHNNTTTSRQQTTTMTAKVSKSTATTPTTTREPRTFPRKLHRLLEEASQKGFDNVICWQPGGKSFKVSDPQKFVETIMPTYFRQSKFKSFQRQLNIYEFQRIHHGSNKGGYAHSCLIQGVPELCSLIKRQQDSTSTSTTGTTSSALATAKAAATKIRCKNGSGGTCTEKRSSATSFTSSSGSGTGTGSSSSSKTLGTGSVPAAAATSTRMKGPNNVFSSSNSSSVSIESSPMLSSAKKTHPTTTQTVGGVDSLIEDLDEIMLLPMDLEPCKVTGVDADPSMVKSRGGALEQFKKNKEDAELMTLFSQHFNPTDDTPFSSSDDFQVDTCLSMDIFDKVGVVGSSSSWSAYHPNYGGTGAGGNVTLDMPLPNPVEDAIMLSPLTATTTTATTTNTTVANTIKDPSFRTTTTMTCAAAAAATTTVLPHLNLIEPTSEELFNLITEEDEHNDDLSKTENVFPLKLHRMLEDARRNGFEHICSWEEGNSGFKVHDADAFVEQIMPEYFDQTKYESFRRQLNLYGFTRLSHCENRGVYYHPQFRQNDRSLCKYITRPKCSRRRRHKS